MGMLVLVVWLVFVIAALVLIREVVPPPAPTGDMQIFAVLETGKTITLDVEEEYLVVNLKWLVQGRKRIPVCQQRLVFNNVPSMQDSETLNFYGVKDGSTLYLIMNLDGGVGAPGSGKRKKPANRAADFLARASDCDIYQAALNWSPGTFTHFLAELSCDDLAKWGSQITKQKNMDRVLTITAGEMSIVQRIEVRTRYIHPV
jgi:Ubiquitin family